MSQGLHQKLKILATKVSKEELEDFLLVDTGQVPNLT